MASSTPPPNYALSTTKPHQNHHHHQNHHQIHRSTRPHHQWPAAASHQRVTLNAAAPPQHPAAATRPPSGPVPLSPSDFSARRSTRFVSKMHFARPKSSASSRHSATAEEALHLAVTTTSTDTHMDHILLTFESRFNGCDDYTFLLRELGNRGEWSMALRCFYFALHREKRKNERGKLASSMISTLGRLGKVDLAKQVFENAVSQGYGNTVYAYSALISAYAKSGYCDDAIRAFETMKTAGLKPNLITYNALIDACGKGGADFKRASMIFAEMVSSGVYPDRITYNSLIAVCSGAGMWEMAITLFNEMADRGIEQDIYTYNTLLDAACSGGHMNVAFEIMADMPAKNVWPNEVTYSTMIRGCAKTGKMDKALSLFHEMKIYNVKVDRVTYNTLLAIYASLGKLEEAVCVTREMEHFGIKKDVVTYNALLDGFGKQGEYHNVKALFLEMKAENVVPNVLTYSTLISVYSKGGLYAEAVKVYREFKRRGLKADVVLYSKLIDALCKRGLVDTAVLLLDEMMKEGIQPNVVTYNSILNAFGQSASVENSDSESLVIRTNGLVQSEEEDRIVKIFKQLASGNLGVDKYDPRIRKDFLCVLGVFKRMHEMQIKPNVVTFSAILNACSQCSSFEEASLLLEELRPFDNQIYGVAHGLLTGHDEIVWLQALSLFDEVKQMDSSTSSAFYNALTDMLWNFGQKRGAQLVVLEGKRRQVWENTWSEDCLDLHLMSSGAARAMVHAWLLDIRSIVFEGRRLPQSLSILTGWGKHSKVVGDGRLKHVIKALLKSIGSPFDLAKNGNKGRFESEGPMVTAWLRKAGTLKLLILQDDRTRFGHTANLQALAS